VKARITVILTLQQRNFGATKHRLPSRAAAAVYTVQGLKKQRIIGVNGYSVPLFYISQWLNLKKSLEFGPETALEWTSGWFSI